MTTEPRLIELIERSLGGDESQRDVIEAALGFVKEWVEVNRIPTTDSVSYSELIALLTTED